MAQLDLLLSEFHSDLQRAGDLLRLIKDFRRFAGSPPPAELKDGTVNWTEAVELADAAPRVRTDLPVLSGSLLLYICGRFEYFVREVVASLADDIAAKATTYEAIPEKIRSELFAKTIDIAQSPRRFGYSQPEAEQLLLVLTDNLRAAGTSGSQTISSRVLAITESNMNSRTISEVFKRIDFGNFWSDIGKQAVLKAHLAAREDGKCTQEARSKLDEMMQERNAIAHPTGAAAFPGPDKVIESATFLQLLSQIIVDLAKVPRT